MCQCRAADTPQTAAPHVMPLFEIFKCQPDVLLEQLRLELKHIKQGHKADSEGFGSALLSFLDHLPKVSELGI